MGDVNRVVVLPRPPSLEFRFPSPLEHIQSEPEAGKALRDELTGLRILRIGRLRIIYRVEKPGIIDIVAIGPRKTIYEETFILVKKEQGTNLIGPDKI